MFLRLFEVVGYAKPDLAAGFSFIGAQFDKIDGTKVKLSDISLENAAGDGTELITILDGDGLVTAQYIWLTEEAVGMSNGWYDFESWESVDIELSEGQGLYFYTDNSGAKVVTSGLVAKDEKSIALSAGFCIVANCSPVDFDLQNLALVDAAGDGSELLTMLGSDGLVAAQYIWLTEESVGMSNGWYDFETWELVTDVSIKAGEGLYMYCNDVGASIVIPSAIAD